MAKCVVCGRTVRWNQHALSCDSCRMWTHRTCGTELTADEYRDMCRKDEDFAFQCVNCRAVISEESLTAVIEDAHATFQLEASMEIDETPNLSATVEVTTMSDALEESHASVFEASMEINEAPDLSAIDITAMSQSIVSDEDIIERSMTEALLEPTAEPIEDNIQHFSIIESGSQKGKKKLADTTGYSYVLRKSTGNKTYWRCSVRNKTMTCPASVIQTQDNFKPGIHNHCHPPVTGQLTAIKVRVEVKQKAVENVYMSGSNVVEAAQSMHINPEHPGGRQKQTTLIRMANRTRELLRPKEPRNLSFELNEEFLPNEFLRADIWNKGERHVVFATDRQLLYLSRSKQWFIDGTFKIVKMPFYQLLSIHAFVRAGASMKMMPLAFVLMSRRRTTDYIKVLTTLLQALPNSPEVKVVLLDFETAAWKALAKVLPDVQIRGCLFHHTQAVYRKSTEIGLSVAYRQQDDVHKFLKKLMALPFLPAADITKMFKKIEERVPEGGLLQTLMVYYRKQWIDHRIFTPRSWSVYKKSVRTNNNVEGWHNRMGNKARDRPQPFYKLAGMLHEEASLIPIQTRLIEEGALTALIRRSVSDRQREIFDAWSEYQDGDIALSTLLTRCASLHGPIL